MTDSGRRRRREILVGVLLFVGVLGLKLPTLDVPYHWDEMTVYVAPAKWLAEEGVLRALPGIHPAEKFFGHPAGLYVIVAAVFRVFGDSIVAVHLLAVGFAYLGVLFTYRLGAWLTDSATGLIAAAFLFFTPIYFAQSGMVLADLPTASLTEMCVYFFLRGRPILYGITAVFLVAFRETGAAVPLSIALWILWYERRSQGCTRRAAGYASPLLLTLGFLVVQKLATGRFVPNPVFADRPILNADPAEILVSFVKVCGWILGAQHRWALTLVILAALLVGSRSLSWRREFTLFSILGGCFALAFSFLDVLPRYLLPTFPFLCVVGAMALSCLIPRFTLRVPAAAVMIALSVSGYFGSDDARDSFSEDMQYVDVVRAHQEAARYVEKHHPEGRVLALWPLSRAITEPYFGYVIQPLSLVDERANADIVLCARQGVPANRELEILVQVGGFRLEHRVERSGKSVDIYVRDRLGG